MRNSATNATRGCALHFLAKSELSTTIHYDNKIPINSPICQVRQQKMQKQATQVIPQSITSLFNYLQDTTQTKAVLDLRLPEEYEMAYVRTATRVQIPNRNANELQQTNMESVTQFIDTHFVNAQLKQRHLLFKKIVLYGNVELVQVLTSLLQQEGKVEKICPCYDFSFEQFYSKYPFMCSSKQGKMAYHKMMPTEIIEDRLYLGSFENANSAEQLHLLQISRIVNMAAELENVFETKQVVPLQHNVEYLKLGIHDTVESSVIELFDQAFQFIDEHLVQEKRVLVHVCQVCVNIYIHCSAIWVLVEVVLL